MRFALLALLLLAACHKEPPPPATPEEAYRAFVAAAASAHETGSAKPLIELFDQPTREALAARAQVAAQKNGEEPPGAGAYQLILGSADVPAVTEVKVLSSSADAATLQVLTDGGSGGTVKMVREAGRWRVHLDAIPGA